MNLCKQYEIAEQVRNEVRYFPLTQRTPSFRMKRSGMRNLIIDFLIRLNN